MSYTASLAALTQAAHELDYYNTNTGCTPIYPQWTFNDGVFEIEALVYLPPHADMSSNTYTLKPL